MQVIKYVDEVTELVQQQRMRGLTIGVVPTMGALHEAHLSLVRRAKERCDYVVVSIFVNPTQFNDPSDLAKYPSTLDKDLEMLSECAIDVVFVPSVEEIYPEPDLRIFEFGSLSASMEGTSRGSHFNGVAQVISKLFAIIPSHYAFFGQKDYQQYLIVSDLAKQLKCGTEVVLCDTVREEHGLAMSSRNTLLTERQWEDAAVIYATLKWVVEECIKGTQVELICERAIDKINSIDDFTVDYLEVVSAQTLSPSYEQGEKRVVCTAVDVGGVRLLDNLLIP